MNTEHCNTASASVSEPRDQLTPRTDAEALRIQYADGMWNKWVTADFARQLECELATKEAELREALICWAEARDELDGKVY